MYRVYFDTNEGCTDRDGYGLWLNPSREDLARIPGGPQDGMKVIIYMTGELEMEAVLSFDQDGGVWTALPIAGTVKHA
jgi:hypothetical protein